MRTSLTYSPPPRLVRARLGTAARRRLRGVSSPRLAQLMVARLITHAVAAVNQRGLCVADVAHLAELPPGEIQAMAQRCACGTCFHARAN